MLTWLDTVVPYRSKADMAVMLNSAELLSKTRSRTTTSRLINAALSSKELARLMKSRGYTEKVRR